jgi:uncharacterized membrane protein (DUF2068 family)
VTWDRVAILATNIVIVLYMLFIRIRESRSQETVVETSDVNA